MHQGKTGKKDDGQRLGSRRSQKDQKPHQLLKGQKQRRKQLIPVYQSKINVINSNLT